MIIKVTIELELQLGALENDKPYNSDDTDRTLRECVYQYLTELIEDDSLAFKVNKL